MKTFAIRLLIVSSLFANLSAFAETTPHETPFNTLQRLYLDANSSALLSDFDKFGAPSNLHCAAASANDITPYEINTPRIIEIANKEAGPLFPGFSKSLLLFSSDWYSEQKLAQCQSEFRTMLELRSLRRELLVIINPKPFSNCFLTGGNAAIRIRKNNHLLALQIISNVGQPNEVIQYAYCYVNNFFIGGPSK